MAQRHGSAPWRPPPPGTWACACCVNFSFDPVPGLEAPARSATGPRSGKRQLHSAACAAVGVEQPREARNIIAQGQSRFEIGQEAPEQPDWERLSPRVTCILGQNPSEYTLNGTNCYLVGTGPKRLLVDAGEEFVGGEAFMEVLAQCMAEQGADGLDGVLITHMHHDHYGNIHRLQEKYGPVPVYCMKGDATAGDGDVVQGIRSRGLMEHFLGPDGWPRFNPKVDLQRPDLPEDLDLNWVKSRVCITDGGPRHSELVVWRPDMTCGARDALSIGWSSYAVHSLPTVELFPGDSTGAKVQYLFFFQWHQCLLRGHLETGRYPWHNLQDGDRIRTEGATLVAMHTPGHAADHMSYLLEEEHALFSGDHVLGWGTTLVFNMKEYMSTLHRMLALKPTRLYPGHGGYIEDGVDILTRYTEHRERREEQAWMALAAKTRPVPIMEIVQELYPNTSTERLWMAKDNVEKLFRKFAADGSAGAWTASVDANGTETLVPLEVSQSYSERRLQDGLLWASRRAMAALPLPGRRAKL